MIQKFAVTNSLLARLSINRWRSNQKYLEESSMPDWTVVYEQYARLLWQTTYRLLRDHDLAAECVQETFLSVIKRPANRQIVDLQKFIITVATRRALDHLRAKYQRQNHCRPLQDVDEVPSGSVSAEQMVLSDELASELRKAPDITHRLAPPITVFCGAPGTSG